MSTGAAKSLSRLSREKLIDLCITWSKSSKCEPYLASNRNILEAEEEDYLHEPAQSRHELKSIYNAFKSDHANLQSLSKRDIIDRILDGDWRRGLSYNQLASIDFACLEEHDTSLRWSALKLVPLMNRATEEKCERPKKRRKLEQYDSVSSKPRYPEISAAIFMRNLKTHISPLVKAHYHIHRLAQLRLSIIRLYITSNAAFGPLSANVPRSRKTSSDAARIMYIALPDSCPYVYVSISGSMSTDRRDKKGDRKAAMGVDIAAIKRVVLEAIPKALSKPQQRWSLQATKLTVKSLQALTLLRGGSKVGACGGPFTHLIQPVNSNTSNKALEIATDLYFDTAPAEVQNNRTYDREVEQKFGNVQGTDHARLDRVQIRVQDVLCSSRTHSKKRKASSENDYEPAPISITMTGSDVFAGLKEFALKHPEYVDIAKLPAAMTGERGTTMLTV